MKSYASINSIALVIVGRSNPTTTIFSTFSLFALSITCSKSSLYLYIVAPLDHPFAKKKDVTIDQLQNETWITREEGSGTGEYLQHVLKSNGLKARTFVTFSSNQAIKEAVIHGMGLSVLSKYVLQRGSIGGELAVISVRGMDFKRKFSYVESPMTGGNKNKELLVELLRKERKDASPQ
ncbi:LysR substrate-binding domain-containing protein [Bacillus subtilis]|uniref:LysR substrate-binding domain-containing protein n=1 Tax=Bacillus subtilis TaxID=1423 RepID=UPI002029ED8B|nr:LysR substrate-binding domain-containing protein [Bacillus subtilis]